MPILLGGRGDLARIPLPLGGAALLPNWTAAKEAAAAGTRNARLILSADSTAYGSFAVSGLTGGNNRSASWPTQLAQSLTAKGVPASWQNWFGNCAIDDGNYYPSMDSRITLPVAGFVPSNTSGFTYGHNALQTNSAGATLRFTPTTSIDTVDIYYQQNTGTGTFTVNFDGGATLATVNTIGTPAYKKLTLSGALGLHAINIVCSSGYAVIFGMAAYNSAVKEISIYNGAIIGSLVSDHIITANPWSDLNCLSVLSPDLAIIDLTINDIQQATSLATYQANLQTLINAYKALNTCDILMVTGNAISTGLSANTTEALQEAYVQAFMAVAAANGIPLLDVYHLMGSYASMAAKGWMGDTVHPNAQGYAVMASLVQGIVQ